MAKKRTKEEKQPSDIFRSLFGKSQKEEEKEKEEIALPLFSNNPYRRKPKSENPKEADGCGESLSQANLTDLVKTSKKKRQIEPIPILNPDTDIDLKTTNKRKKPTNERTEEEEEANGVGEKKNKKKRKRDEIEEEYEARKYGVVAEKIDDGDTGLVGVNLGKKRKAADEYSEMVVSKEGYDDESKLQRTVFVGNLPLKVKKKSLLKEFRNFGEIESIRIRSVPIIDSKIPRKGAVIKGKFNESVDSVHAYIVFEDEQSAQAALSHNMAKIGENHIRVDRACPPRKKLKGENAAPLYDNKRTVFVGNLPFDVKDEELYQLFCGINQLESSIEAIRVVRDPHTSLGKGIAYILFKTRDAANLVVKKKNLKLRDRDLRLYHARLDSSTPSKRKRELSAWQDKSPSKKLALDSNDKPANDSKPKAKAASLSYQGLRASKSGIQKKVSTQQRIEVQKKSKPERVAGIEKKIRKTKRPSVAARKAKMAAAAGGGGAARQTVKKRKLESRTPENFHNNKKARRFK